MVDRVGGLRGGVTLARITRRGTEICTVSYIVLVVVQTCCYSVIDRNAKCETCNSCEQFQSGVQCSQNIIFTRKHCAVGEVVL